MIRPDNRIEMLSLFPQGGVIAELGVFRGVFSERILEKCRPKILYMVDTWACSTDWVIDGVVQSVSGNEAYRYSCRLERIDSVRLRRQTTIEFLVSQADESLDVVYQDADHSFESVRDELAMSWPRIKPGGWFSGHDYCELFPGVVRAVSEFLALHSLTLDVLTSDVPGIVINCPGGPEKMAYNSFAFQKPK